MTEKDAYDFDDLLLAAGENLPRDNQMNGRTGDSIYRGGSAMLSPHLRAMLLGKSIERVTPQRQSTPSASLSSKLGPPIRTPVGKQNTTKMKPHSASASLSKSTGRVLGTPVRRRRSKSLSGKVKSNKSKNGKSKDRKKSPSVAKRASPRPAWDSTIHDLNKYKLSEKQLLEQRVLHTSRFDHTAHERLEKEAGITVEEQARTLSSVLSPPWVIKRRSFSVSDGSVSDLSNGRDDDNGILHQDEEQSSESGEKSDASKEEEQEQELEQAISQTFSELINQVLAYQAVSSHHESIGEGLDHNLTGRDRELALMKLCMRLTGRLASNDYDISCAQEQAQTELRRNEQLKGRLQKAEQQVLELEERCKELEKENLHFTAICSTQPPSLENQENLSEVDQRISRRQQLMAKWRATAF